MRSRKCRTGSKKWRRTNHKTLNWYITNLGTSSVAQWQRNGRR